MTKSVFDEDAIREELNRRFTEAQKSIEAIERAGRITIDDLFFMVDV